jgi:hypothetical protein
MSVMDFLSNLTNPSMQAQQSAASQFGTNVGSQQNIQLANQEQAFKDNSTGVPNAPFDLKGLAKDMFSNMAANQTGSPMDMATKLPIASAKVMQPRMPQGPIAQNAMNQPIQPSSQGAMNAITGGMGNSPTFMQMLNGIGYGR